MELPIEKMRAAKRSRLEPAFSGLWGALDGMRENLEQNGATIWVEFIEKTLKQAERDLEDWS